MNNILDYLDWRGDLSFDASPFCDVDALVLCRLSYIPFESTVPNNFNEHVKLSSCAEKILDEYKNDPTKIAFRDENDPNLLEKIIDSKRFSEIGVSGYINVISQEIEKQFSATTFLMPDKTLYVAFRGTDGTLVGWKEDFNMSFIDIVPAQSDALAYLEKVADNLHGKIRVGGHSKGGNLAVYSSAFCMGKVQKRIIEIRNFDGPGFNENMISKENFKHILSKTKTYLPQSSIIGMLLEHAEDFSVVFSKGTGILQHDIYTWDVVRNGLNCIEELTSQSHFIDSTLKDWLSEMTMEQREKMIDGIYSIMIDSDITTTQNLFNRKNITAFLKNYESADENTKNDISITMKMLRKSFKNSLIEVLNNIQKKEDSNAEKTADA